VYWNAIRSGTLGLLQPAVAVGEAVGEEAGELGAAVGFAAAIRPSAATGVARREPFARDRLDRLPHRLRRRRGQAAIGVVDGAGEWEEHVLRDQAERVMGRGGQAGVGVLRIKRRAVVDQPGAPVPGQQVRVSWRAVQVHHERVEPHDVGTEVGIGDSSRRRGEAERTRQEVDAQVQADACDQQILDLRIGLGHADLRVEIHQHELGYR